MKRLKFKGASKIKVGADKDYQRREATSLRHSLSSCTNTLSLSNKTRFVSVPPSHVSSLPRPQSPGTAYERVSLAGQV